MVRTLILEVDTDQDRDYKIKQYKQSDKYRTILKKIPEIFKNRPNKVISELMRLKNQGTLIPESDILSKTDKQGCYDITSQSNRDITYECSVIQGFCTCTYFTRNHIPCKHMFCVFEHTNYTWNDLPPQIKNANHLIIDESSISESPLYLEKVQDTSESTDITQNSQASEPTEPTSQTNSNNEKRQKKLSQAQMAKKCIIQTREKIQQLLGLLYQLDIKSATKLLNNQTFDKINQTIQTHIDDINTTFPLGDSTRPVLNPDNSIQIYSETKNNIANKRKQHFQQKPNRPISKNVNKNNNPREIKRRIKTLQRPLDFRLPMPAQSTQNDQNISECALLLDSLQCLTLTETDPSFQPTQTTLQNTNMIIKRKQYPRKAKTKFQNETLPIIKKRTAAAALEEHEERKKRQKCNINKPQQPLTPTDNSHFHIQTYFKNSSLQWMSNLHNSCAFLTVYTGVSTTLLQTIWNQSIPNIKSNNLFKHDGFDFIYNFTIHIKDLFQNQTIQSKHSAENLLRTFVYEKKKWKLGEFATLSDVCKNFLIFLKHVFCTPQTVP